jgi:hypothetical protein
VGLSALRRGRLPRSTWRWKVSRTAEAYAFHEAPAESVLAAFESSRPAAKAASAGGTEGGDRDISIFSKGRANGATCRAPRIRGRSSEVRAVKRGPPRSHWHRAAPSLSVHGPSPSAKSLGGGPARARDGTRVSTRRKLRDEGSRSEGAERRRRDGGRTGRRRDAGVRVGVSECRKSVGRIGSRAARGRAIASGHAGWVKGRHADAVTARGEPESDRSGAGVVERLPRRGAMRFAGSARKPRRDRTRRGAGSETREVSGPRARDVQADGQGAWAVDSPL